MPKREPQPADSWNRRLNEAQKKRLPTDQSPQRQKEASPRCPSRRTTHLIPPLHTGEPQPPAPTEEEPPSNWRDHSKASNNAGSRVKCNEGEREHQDTPQPLKTAVTHGQCTPQPQGTPEARGGVTQIITPNRKRPTGTRGTKTKANWEEGNR